MVEGFVNKIKIRVYYVMVDHLSFSYYVLHTCHKITLNIIEP